MDILLVVLGSVVGLALGLWAGLRWGMRLSGGAAWKYWAANVVVALAGFAISTGGLMLGAMWFAVAGVGVMGGGVTGLKYGYGSNPGVWAVHDRLMGIDGPPVGDGSPGGDGSAGGHGADDSAGGGRE